MIVGQDVLIAHLLHRTGVVADGGGITANFCLWEDSSEAHVKAPYAESLHIVKNSSTRHRPAPHASVLRRRIVFAGRSQSEICAGCIVSWTASIRCWLRASRSTSLRCRAPNVAMVWAASYLWR